jgi:CBS domain-containing protein
MPGIPIEESVMREASTVGDICVRNVAVAPPQLSVDEAARLMRERHVGSLVVVELGDGGRLPSGVLTDRDIVTAVVAKDIDAKSLRVADVMSPSVVTVREGDSLYDALTLMRHHGVRRLPVVGSHGVLAGIVTLDDVVGALAGQLQAAVMVVGRELRHEAVARP